MFLVGLVVLVERAEQAGMVGRAGMAGWVEMAALPVAMVEGSKGILVMTGETKEDDLAVSRIKADAVFPSVKEIADCLNTL